MSGEKGDHRDEGDVALSRQERGRTAIAARVPVAHAHTMPPHATVVHRCRRQRWTTVETKLWRGVSCQLTSFWPWPLVPRLLVRWRCASRGVSQPCFLHSSWWRVTPSPSTCCPSPCGRSRWALRTPSGQGWARLSLPERELSCFRRNCRRSPSLELV